MNLQILIACIQINLLRCPLMRPQTVQDVLNKSRDEVDSMIEDGSLPFAFDLSTNQGARKDPRIFTLCVAENTGWKNPVGQTKNFKLPEVIGMILPKRDVRSTELKKIFACGGDHVYQLAKNNFTVTRQPTAKDGPDSYTVFQRASVEKFLEKRRMI
jgi:hypothetical protein